MSESFDFSQYVDESTEQTVVLEEYDSPLPEDSDGIIDPYSQDVDPWNLPDVDPSIDY